MKITFDHEIFSIQRYGGASRYFYELIVHLLKYPDADVSAFMGFFTNEYGLEKYKNEFNLFRGLKHKEIPKTKLLFIKLNNMMFPSFLKRSKPDIYHQTYYGDIVKKVNAKRIVTVLDMTHELFPDEFNQFDKTREDKKVAVQRADGIICISESTKNDLIRIFNVDPNIVKVVYLANSLDTNIKGKRIIEDDYIMFVGGRRGYKNFENLLKAYASSAEINQKLKLVCVGGGGFRPYELKMIEEAKLNDKVMYLSGGDEMLAGLYKYAFALVYPSKYEGFGIPPLEAMNFDCPVITTNISSIPEVTGDAALYIDPNSPGDIKDKILLLLHDGRLRSELVEKGRVQKEKFSWEKCAAETFSFYKEILNNRS